MHTARSFDWGYLNLPAARCAYLDGTEFDEIRRRIIAEAEIASFQVEVRRGATLSGCRRVAFKIAVSAATGDLFFNGRDGYRAKYWQSPLVGVNANRQLLNSLVDFLLAGFMRDTKEADAARANWDEELAGRSLGSNQAKLWINELGNPLPRIGVSDPQLDVARWRNYQTGRWAPVFRVLDVKGGWLDQAGEEWEDRDKRYRAEEIHKTGYT